MWSMLWCDHIFSFLYDIEGISLPHHKNYRDEYTTAHTYTRKEGRAVLDFWTYNRVWTNMDAMKAVLEDSRWDEFSLDLVVSQVFISGWFVTCFPGQKGMKPPTKHITEIGVLKLWAWEQEIIFFFLQIITAVVLPILLKSDDYLFHENTHMYECPITMIPFPHSSEHCIFIKNTMHSGKQFCIPTSPLHWLFNPIEIHLLHWG